MANLIEPMDVYKSQSYLQDEIENLETLKPENLANKAVFSKGKNYFLQVVGNQEHTNEENEVTHQNKMDSHYYHIKKLCRRKNIPLFPFKIDINDFRDEASWSVLREALNIESIHELQETSYVLINANKMKLP